MPSAEQRISKYPRGHKHDVAHTEQQEDSSEDWVGCRPDLGVDIVPQRKRFGSKVLNCCPSLTVHSLERPLPLCVG